MRGAPEYRGHANETLGASDRLRRDVGSPRCAGARLSASRSTASSRGSWRRLVAVLVPWLPTSASEEMDRIEFTFWFTTVICIAVFSVVAAAIVYSVLKFRVQPEDESDGPPIHGHTGLEIVWTAIPAVLVTAISIVSAVVLAKNDDAGPNPLRIAVTAQQFAWKFEYPGKSKVTSGQLVLPVDRPVKLTLHSRRRDPLVLGAGVRPEVRRSPGNRDDARDHAESDGAVRLDVHGALRARARDDARATSASSSSADYEKFLAKARRRARARIRARRSSRPPAAGPVTRSRRPAPTPRSGRASTRSSRRREAARGVHPRVDPRIRMPSSPPASSPV